MKRIIIACDGTGQSASRGTWAVSTNVNRLCHALLNPAHTSTIPQQLVFYISGVGTADLGMGQLGTMVQGALGEGLEENVADAYTFLINNYLPGDELFIFGFSRGAFTARVLANFVARLGVLSKSYSWAFKDALEKYKEGPEAFDKYIVELREAMEKDKRYWRKERGELIPRAYDVKVKVVGCWDTVASLGIPWRPSSNAGGVSGEYQHFDGSLAKGIENAFHALALDEYRGPFTPTLWYLPRDEETAKTINLKQCWFPGVHTNIGGGYSDQALADLTFLWMIDLCRPHLAFDTSYLLSEIKIDHHPSQIKSKKRLAHKDGGPDTVYQGWGCGKWYDSYKQGQTWSWKYRTPGEYVHAEKEKWGATNETLHASVRERWEKMPKGPWRPQALHGFEYREAEGGGVEWVKKDRKGNVLVMLKEEAFPTEEPAKPDVSFEWLLRYSPITPAPAKEASK